MTNEWILVEDELPPCDGYYWATSDPLGYIWLSFYDGTGFMSFPTLNFPLGFEQPKFWHVRDDQKRYGKIKKSQMSDIPAILVLPCAPSTHFEG